MSIMSAKKSHPDRLYKYDFFFATLFIGLLFYFGVKEIKNGASELEQNFPFRNQLVSLITDFRLIIGDRVFQQALVSNDNGWLEFTGGGNLDDYQNATPFSTRDIKNIQESLQEMNRNLSPKQITLLVVVAPNKATIYPENIPI